MREKSAEVLFIPKFMLIPLFISITWNSITYFGSRLLTTNWHHINAEISLDSIVPLVPWTVFIYLSCYIYWLANYILGVRQSREEAFRFISADFFAKTICLIQMRLTIFSLPFTASQAGFAILQLERIREYLSLMCCFHWFLRYVYAFRPLQPSSTL